MQNNETSEITPQAAEADASTATASNQAEPSSADASAASAAELDDSLPEKFRGKSIQDVGRSYKELEKTLGKISSERSHAQKENDALKGRLAEIESRLQMIQTQPAPSAPAPEPDPLASLDEEFEVDPKGTLKKVVKHLSEQPRRLEESLNLKQRSREAAEFYEREMKDNQEFRELEPDMKRLTSRYAHLVRPELINSRETMELLYSLAKAGNIDRYSKAAAEKALKANNLVKDEKRRAASESSAAGSSENSRRFEDYSLDEMKKLLGSVER